MASKAFKTNNIKVVRDGYNKANEMIIDLSKSKKLKSIKSKIEMRLKITKKPIFLTFGTKKILYLWKQAFIKALIV